MKINAARKGKLLAVAIAGLSAGIGELFESVKSGSLPKKQASLIFQHEKPGTQVLSTDQCYTMIKVILMI